MRVNFGNNIEKNTLQKLTKAVEVSKPVQVSNAVKETTMSAHSIQGIVPGWVGWALGLLAAGGVAIANRERIEKYVSKLTTKATESVANKVESTVNKTKEHVKRVYDEDLNVDV